MAGMARAKSELRERRQQAYTMFTQGFRDRQIADRLGCHVNTVGRYRTRYEEELAQQAAANPQLLRDVIANTTRALLELDEVRTRAWEEFERASGQMAECPNCEYEFLAVGASAPSTRNAILTTITRAQEQRGKLLGLFGVKQEFFLHVQSVRIVQERLLGFMRDNLCAEDKKKLETLLTTELNEHLGRVADMPAIEASAVEVV